MDYVCAVQEIQGAKYVIHYSHHVLLLECVSLELAENAVQIHVDALHHQEDVVEFLCWTCRLAILGRNQNVKKARSENIILHLSQLTEYHDFP